LQSDEGEASEVKAAESLGGNVGSRGGSHTEEGGRLETGGAGQGGSAHGGSGLGGYTGHWLAELGLGALWVKAGRRVKKPEPRALR
jgi:hypothetical protein